MLYTINYNIFWKIAVPLSLLLSTSINRIVSQQFLIFYILISLLLLLFIPANINMNAAWWVTGYYNYLMPLSLATYALSFMYAE